VTHKLNSLERKHGENSARIRLCWKLIEILGLKWTPHRRPGGSPPETAAPAKTVATSSGIENASAALRVATSSGGSSTSKKYQLT
jgi:hypothetical protein